MFWTIFVYLVSGIEDKMASTTWLLLGDIQCQRIFCWLMSEIYFSFINVCRFFTDSSTNEIYVHLQISFTTDRSWFFLRITSKILLTQDGKAGYPHLWCKSYCSSRTVRRLSFYRTIDFDPHLRASDASIMPSFDLLSMSFSSSSVNTTRTVSWTYSIQLLKFKPAHFHFSLSQPAVTITNQQWYTSLE